MSLIKPARVAAFWRSAAGPLGLSLLLAQAGCGFASMIETNTAAIHSTTATMRSASERLDAANRSMAALDPRLAELARLQGPMQETAAIARPLEGIVLMGPQLDQMKSALAESAALRQPLLRLTELEPAMLGLVPLKKPLEDVADIGPTLKDVASLRPSMEGVAALDMRMKALAELKEPMERVAALRPSLEEVSSLGEPVTELARAARSGGPGAGTITLFLLGWTAATFAGVFLGFVAGARCRERRRGRALARREIAPLSSHGAGALGAITRGTTHPGSAATQ
jgi:hypothetical protein